MLRLLFAILYALLHYIYSYRLLLYMWYTIWVHVVYNMGTCGIQYGYMWYTIWVHVVYNMGTCGIQYGYMWYIIWVHVVYNMGTCGIQYGYMWYNMDTCNLVSLCAFKKWAGQRLVVILYVTCMPSMHQFYKN